MKLRHLAAAGALAAFAALPASAAVITLDFEGVGDLNAVGSFYSGLGIEFSQDTLALVDADAGGSGNFANEPSGDTVMFFLNANNAILNFAAGFDTGFSFFYSSSVAAMVSVWDGLNGTGNLLGQIALLGDGVNGPGDPTGDFATWNAGGVAFSGIARSINFGGTANQTGYDNITFGSATPGAVPVPAAAPLLLGALAGLGLLRRRRRAAV